jgi:hypothetical protein
MLVSCTSPRRLELSTNLVTGFLYHVRSVKGGDDAFFLIGGAQSSTPFPANIGDGVCPRRERPFVIGIAIAIVGVNVVRVAEGGRSMRDRMWCPPSSSPQAREDWPLFGFVCSPLEPKRSRSLPALLDPVMSRFVRASKYRYVDLNVR